MSLTTLLRQTVLGHCEWWGLRGDGTDRPWGELTPSVEDLLERRTDLTLVDLATPARKIFGTDRAMDMMILGFAYQRGEIPLRGIAFRKHFEKWNVKGLGVWKKLFCLVDLWHVVGARWNHPNLQHVANASDSNALAKGGNWGAGFDKTSNV